MVIGLEFQTVEEDLDIDWYQYNDDESQDNQSDSNIEKYLLLGCISVGLLHQKDHETLSQWDNQDPVEEKVYQLVKLEQ